MKTAIITGGAGGLGQAMAAGLQAKGWYIVLLDLAGPALDAIPENALQKPYGCDLTNPAQMRTVFAEIRADRPSIDMVIYNAGITQIGAFADSDLASHRQVFEVNYFAAIESARAFVPDIRAAKGTHLAISSVAGFTPLLHRTAYAASKHALQGFFSSLRSEEKPYDVQVSVAAPSFVATNLGNSEATETGIARPGSATDGVDYMSAKDAATIILNGVERGKPFIPVGRIASLATLVNRLSPSLYQRLMERNLSGT